MLLLLLLLLLLILISTGELLAEESVGTDAAREAKIEETLRKMGVQGIEENRAKAKENKSVGDQITSIFDVSLTETAAPALAASPIHTYSPTRFVI